MVKALWDAKIITVTLDKGEGDSVTTETVYVKYDSNIIYQDAGCETPIVTPPTASKLAYDFNGFYYDGSLVISSVGALTSPWTLSEGPTITLTAEFKPHTYTITYQGNYGNPSVSDTEYTYVSEIVFATATRDGYTFGGWKVKNEGDIGNWVVDQVYQGTIDAPSNLYGDITLVAEWTATPYTATFNTDGGSTVDPIPYDIESTLTMPTVSKAGYKFTGWTVDETVGNWNKDATYQIGEQINNKFGNVSFTANWAESTDTKYQVHIYYQNLDKGYTTFETSQRYGTTGQTITIDYATNPNAVTITDSNKSQTYSRDGFHVDTTQSNTQSATVGANGDTVINVYFARNEYTLTVNAGNGISSVTPNGATSVIF